MRIAFLGSLLLVLPGCMTISSQFRYLAKDTDEELIEFVYKPPRSGSMNYAGVKMNAWLFTPNPVTIAYIDLPLCLVLDTVLLPLTLLETASVQNLIRERESRDDPEAP